MGTLIIALIVGLLIGSALTIWAIVSLKDNGYITMSATDKLIKLLKS